MSRPDFASFLDIPREEWLDGTVVSIMNYGAFVRLQGGVDGMVHISQLHPHGERVDSVAEAVQVGTFEKRVGSFHPAAR